MKLSPVTLSNSTIMHQFSKRFVNSKVYASELLFVLDQTSIVSKRKTEIADHLQIVKCAL